MHLRENPTKVIQAKDRILIQNNTRSKIGDSPLTSKEFSINKISAKGVENFGTFADNYKNGLNPSERMRKFNSNKISLPNSLEERSSLMIRDYNKNSEFLNKNLDVNGREAGFDSVQPKAGINQNLRLLKTKIRLSSATSNESDVYVQNSKHDEFKSYRNNEEIHKNLSEDFGMKPREGQNITVVMNFIVIFNRLIFQLINL